MQKLLAQRTMLRFLVGVSATCAIVSSVAPAADVLSRHQVVNLALNWLLFDDHGVKPPGDAPIERPIDEGAAYLRARLSAARQIYVVFPESDGVDIGAVYDTASRSLGQGTRLTTATNDVRPAGRLFIAHRKDGSWTVRFPIDGGASGPVAEVLHHSQGWYVRYRGLRIVCP